MEQVTKRFGKQIAVDSLDLCVPEGAIYGFIGPNGSGKTTTLRMILRIFQADSGVVRVLGSEHGKTADDRLGYLPEERGLYKRMKVRDILTYYARLKGAYDCQPEINRWLERLGATDWVNKKIDALSKGMAQKIQFISAWCKPKLVILDEPFSGLDPVNLESLKVSRVLTSRRGNDDRLFDSRHGHGRADVRHNLHDLSRKESSGRNAVDDSSRVARRSCTGPIRRRFIDASDSWRRRPATNWSLSRFPNDRPNPLSRAIGIAGGSTSSHPF